MIPNGGDIFNMKSTFLSSIAIALVASVSIPALASASVVNSTDLIIDLDTINQHVHGPACSHNNALSSALEQKHQAISGNAAYVAMAPAIAAVAPGVPASTGASSQGTQLVFLDFDSATTGTYTRTYKENADGTGADVTQVFQEHIYTAPERAAVMASMQNDYGHFDIAFTTEKPAGGEYSTLFFNANMPGEGNGVEAGIRVADGGRVTGILWGAADNIDFRNLNRTDNANLDANFWDVISDSGFTTVTGLAATEENRAIAITRQTAQTGSHELGHDLGLRHHEAWGPLGTGLPTTGVPADGQFIPVYTGPRGADETTRHLMVSGASGGSSLGGSVTQDRFFGLRSATKLTFNEEGRVIQEQAGPGAQFVELVNLDVPNTVENGRDKNNRIRVAAISIEGRISESDETDLYMFEGNKGDIFNFELTSFVNSNNLDYMDGILAIFDDLGNFLTYNDDDFEGVDSFLFDFVLEYTGRFFVQVSSYNFLHPIDTVDGDFSIGNYQLYATRTTIPAPGIFGLMILGLVAMGRRKSLLK